MNILRCLQLLFGPRAAYHRLKSEIIVSLLDTPQEWEVDREYLINRERKVMIDSDNGQVWMLRTDKTRWEAHLPIFFARICIRRAARIVRVQRARVIFVNKDV